MEKNKKQNKVLTLSLEVLEWAANKKGATLEAFVRTLYAKESTVQSMLSGKLTFPQIKKVAESTGVPFGFLLLKTPPRKYQVNKEFIDFRTVRNSQPLSENFLDVYKDVEHKQNWYKKYQQELGIERLSFVGKYEHQPKSIELIAKDIRSTIGIDALRKTVKNPEQYLSGLVSRCEDIGILVFRSSVVTNFTKRRLNVEEFRGFVIADEVAPAIFLNGDDSRYANIFTLAHELAHIWLGESGVSDNDIQSSNMNEVRCNAIAAEILVPHEEFGLAWDGLDLPLDQKLIELNRIFKVSTLVIARLALTNGKLSREAYGVIHAEVLQKVKDDKAKNKGAKAIIPWGITLPIKNSPKVTATVLSLVKSQKMMPREASVLLNTSPISIAAL